MSLRARSGWLKVAVMLIGLAVMAPLPLLAQGDTVTTTVHTEEEDNEFPWGLLGLLGLLGLIPRRRKDVHVHDVHTRPVPPRDDRAGTPPPPPRP